MGPVFYSSRKSGLPSWGNATERHQPYEVLEKRNFEVVFLSRLVRHVAKEMSQCTSDWMTMSDRN